MQRWIIHVDLDAFFASVEELLNPQLRGKPIIVGGDPHQRGVVSSASYAARAYGVRSAMPTMRALRLCPQAVLVPPRHSEYARRSQAVMDILEEITPLVEQISVDEAFLDVTGCERLWGPAIEMGRLIQRRISEEQHLPASLGIAASKLVAKIACDVGKPHGLVMVQPGEEQEFLAPLAIEKLWGVGRVTGARLRGYGIKTIGDLSSWTEERLIQTFGEMGRSLYFGARGTDLNPVRISHERRSISQERTFARDIGDGETVRRLLLQMSEDLASSLRRQQLIAQTVRIKLRYPDFTTVTRQVTLAQPTDQGAVVLEAAQQLLAHNWHDGQLLRLFGVAVSGLLDGAGYQLSLFEQVDQKQIRLDKALDEIRDRFGRRAITRASLLAGHHRNEDEQEAEDG
jgi:DNA polymerase-4